ncbi:aldolase II superfamily protein [compost metagenome]
MQADLGTSTYFMLRNHGLLTVGKSVADAFLAMYLFESTCQIQLAAQAGGALLQVDPHIIEGAAHAASVQTSGLGGDFVWPALLRKLDRTDASYRT